MNSPVSNQPTFITMKPRAAGRWQPAYALFSNKGGVFAAAREEAVEEVRSPNPPLAQTVVSRGIVVVEVECGREKSSVGYWQVSQGEKSRQARRA